MGDKRNIQKFWCGSHKERDNQKDLNMEENAILKWVLDKWDGVVWT
jgi:hypothetical protein